MLGFMPIYYAINLYIVYCIDNLWFSTICILDVSIYCWFELIKLFFLSRQKKLIQISFVSLKHLHFINIFMKLSIDINRYFKKI